MTLGDFIRNYRSEHGYSLRTFSDICHVSNAYLSMLEKGSHPTTGKPIVPTVRVLGQIAHAMGLTLDELLSRVEDMPVDVSSRVNPITKLHEEESLVLLSYRFADDTTKEMVRRILSPYYPMAETMHEKYSLASEKKAIRDIEKMEKASGGD